MGIIRESGKRSQEKISPKSVNYLNVLVFGKKSDGFSFVYFSQCLIFFFDFFVHMCYDRKQERKRLRGIMPEADFCSEKNRRI